MPAGARDSKTTTTQTVQLTWPQLLGWRASRHHLDRRVPVASRHDVVSHLGGLHAQVMASAELSMVARVDGWEQGILDRELWEERVLVKTWAQRGTLHVLDTSDYPTWQAALSTYDHFYKGAYLRGFGITREQLDALLQAVPAALDGRQLTREELAAAVAQHTGDRELGDKLRDNWGALLKPCSYLGLLCFASSDDSRVRFARPDQWLKGLGPRQDPDESIREVTRRYLAAYGPATREDYARWVGHQPPQAGKLIQSLGEEVTQVEVDGRSGWMLTADAEQAAKASPASGVRLLPSYDPWVIGASREVDEFFPGPYRDRVYLPQAQIAPVILVDGLMAGVWRQDLYTHRVAFRLEPFEELKPAVRRAVEDEAARIASFLGLTPETTWA